MNERDETADTARPILRKPEPVGGMSGAFEPFHHRKPWDPIRGMWVDQRPNRAERRKRRTAWNSRYVDALGPASPVHHVSKHCGLGVTRKASTRRLSTAEVLRHLARDADALRRARFSVGLPDQPGDFDLLGPPAATKRPEGYQVRFRHGVPR